MSEKPHAHMLYIPTELYVGLIKRMAKLEISQSSAILDCLNETLFNEGFIDKETYQKFKERYHKKLVEVVKEKEKFAFKEPPREILELRKTMAMIVKEWDLCPEKSKKYWIKKAEELKDVSPEAKEILRKAGIEVQL